MALVIEDGTGVADATSYATADEIIAYALARGITIEPGPAVDVLAIKAMDYLATQCFKGELAYPGVQFLNWPRKGLIEGDLADDYVYSIPAGIKQAQLQLALDVSTGIVLLQSRAAEPQLKRKKVGPLEKEYFEGGSYLPDLPFAMSLLAPYTCGQGFKLRSYRA